MSTEQAESKDTGANQVPAPRAGSAPASKPEPVAGSQSEASSSGNQDGSKPAKGVEVEFFKLRQERRDLRESDAQKAKAIAERDAQIAAMQTRLEALEKAPKESPRPDNSVDESKLFEDPKAVLDKVKQDTLEMMRQERSAEIRRYELDKAQVEAVEMLLTRSHILQNENFKREVASLLHEGGKYHRLANEDPQAAARLAYFDVCEVKGVSPDMSRKKSNAQEASTGIKPSAAGSGEAPVITAEDVRKGKFSEADVRKAHAEGRYKGRVIKI